MGTPEAERNNLLQRGLRDLSITTPGQRAGGWAAVAVNRRAGIENLAEILDDLRADRL